MSSLDKDKDGSISKSEAASDAGLAKAFVSLDKNKDGKLSKDEVGERFQSIVSRADANKDGVATKEELEELVRSEEPTTGRSRN